MSESQPWHRLFDLSWRDFFRGTAIRVESEMDLSEKQQYLDVALIREGTEPITKPLPDGFDNLGRHNLITFKSYQETLDAWALKEQIGHFVNYRKQHSPSMQELLPEDDFRLYAVCARFPQNLTQVTTLTPRSQGVYEIQVLGTPIRIIVLSQLPQEEQNAMLHLFSGRVELLRYAREHYRPHSKDSTTLLTKLLQLYREDPTMSDKLDEFVEQTIHEFLESLPKEELLKYLSPEERLKGLSPEELRKRLPPEERLNDLSTEEMLKALSPEAREALERHLKTNGSSKQE